MEKKSKLIDFLYQNTKKPTILGIFPTLIITGFLLYTDMRDTKEQITQTEQNVIDNKDVYLNTTEPLQIQVIKLQSQINILLISQITLSYELEKLKLECRPESLPSDPQE
jgi:histone acetyltransferase (RNA polymerase elongator complex component)